MAGQVWGKLAAIVLASVLVLPSVQAQLLLGGSDGQPKSQESVQLSPNQFPVSLNFDQLFDEYAEDYDGDSVPDYRDNCFEIPNRDQWDMDGDGTGDACDEDIDGDGVENQWDECPLVATLYQEDWDGDGIGNVCDDDVDGDGFQNSSSFVWGSGSGHTCWYANGQVSCVGSFNGEPIEVPAYLGRPSKISGGEGFTCGLVDTQLRCFGVDTDWLPQNLSNVSDFDASAHNLCVIVGGQVQCWSSWGSEITYVPSLNYPRKVVVGFDQACAIAEQDVHCWGDYTIPRSFPLQNPVDLAMGQDSVCAKDDHGWRCWGRGEEYFPAHVQVQMSEFIQCALERGELRCFEAANGYSLFPEMEWARYLSVGTNHVCVIQEVYQYPPPEHPFQLRCDGDVVAEQAIELPLASDNCPFVENRDQDDYDRDGIGDACDEDIDGDGVPDLAKPVWGSGYNHTCWVANGQLECIGDNGYGPIEIPQDFPTPDKIAGGHGFTCGLADDVLSCFGQNSQWLPSQLSKVSELGASKHAMCAVVDGDAHCWTPDGDYSLSFLGITHARKLSVAGENLCVIDELGVQCWGENIPLPPYNFINPVDVVVSNGAACVNDDSGWRCWGDHNLDIDGVSFYLEVDLVASDTSICALDHGWVMRCWGENYFYINYADYITIGSEHMCAISAGQLHCDGIAEQRPFELVMDNCPYTENADQKDIDGDGLGDACDDDVDGDGVPNDSDAFPRDATESQDTDGDGIGDNVDNCPQQTNAGQNDVDGDGLGDACDDDIDGDGVPNEFDAFPFDPTETRDSDGDGIGDTVDNCSSTANADQHDSNHNGIGDACENIGSCRQPSY